MILIMCLFSIDSACSFLPQDNLIIRRCDCIYFDWMIIREWGWSPCHHKVHTMFLTSTWLGCLGVVMDVICVVIDYSWIDVSIHTFISIMECQYWSYHWVTLSCCLIDARWLLPSKLREHSVWIILYNIKHFLKKNFLKSVIKVSFA